MIRRASSEDGGSSLSKGGFSKGGFLVFMLAARIGLEANGLLSWIKGSHDARSRPKLDVLDKNSIGLHAGEHGEERARLDYRAYNIAVPAIPWGVELPSAQHVVGGSLGFLRAAP
jgi:hypothetical protein